MVAQVMMDVCEKRTLYCLSMKYRPHCRTVLPEIENAILGQCILVSLFGANAF